MAIPVKFTVRGTTPKVGEDAHDASSGVITALTFIIKEAARWFGKKSFAVKSVDIQFPRFFRWRQSLFMIIS